MDYQASRKLIFQIRDAELRWLLLRGLCEESWRTRKRDRPKCGALARGETGRNEAQPLRAHAQGGRREHRSMRALRARP